MPRVETLDQWLTRLTGMQPGESLPDAIKRAQLRALNATLRTAQKSRFYQALRSRLPESVSSLADLASLPFTVPADLVRWGDFLCVSQSEVARMVSLTTSGTTGTPKRLAFTAADLDRTRDFFGVGMAQMVCPGDAVGVLLPGMNRPSGVADLLRLALPQAAVLGVSVEQARTERMQVLVLLPSQLRQLMESPPWSELHGVLTSGDVLDATTRSACLNWHPGVLHLDHYGLTETCFGGGVECLAHAGYHLREADLIVEIVDGNGTPLPDGETGEVVITTLLREAMPLIRYRTGDVSRLLPGPCPCGSLVRRLEGVRGRLTHSIFIEALSTSTLN